VKSASDAARLRWQQARTVVLLFLGYGAYYFCRADLSVATPLLVKELGTHGVAAADALERIGAMTSWGVFAYAVGKLALTGLGDLWGGRRSFLIGLGGAALFTVMFAAGGGLPIFTLAWIGNRLLQSIGWAGLIKVSSRWFDFSSYGGVIGVLSVSYLVGDALARLSMGGLIGAGFGWRSLFAFAAAIAALLFTANFLWLRESRVEAGFGEAQVNPLNLYADSTAPPRSLLALLLPLLRSPAFILVCVLSFGCTLVRETFNSWTPAYLVSLGYTAEHAASLSAIFPGVGVASVLLTGWLSDRLGVTGRALMLMTGLALSATALGLLTATPPAAAGTSLALIGLVAFTLLGPYSLLGGAFALDFGGKQAGAASSGMIDGVGYLGGVLAGHTAVRLSVVYGWRGVFTALGLASAAAAAAAGYLYVHQRRRALTQGA
jgi:sugar phosphate permease